MDDQKKGERVEMSGRLPHEPSPPSQDVFDIFPKLQFLQFCLFELVFLKAL